MRGRRAVSTTAAWAGFPARALSLSSLSNDGGGWRPSFLGRRRTPAPAGLPLRFPAFPSASAWAGLPGAAPVRLLRLLYISMDYGEVANNLPPPEETERLLKSTSISKPPLPRIICWPGFIRLVIAFGLLLLVSLHVLCRHSWRPLAGSAVSGDSGRRVPYPAALFLSLSVGAAASIKADLRVLTTGPHLTVTPTVAGLGTHVLGRLRAAGLQTLTREYAPLLVPREPLARAAPRRRVPACAPSCACRGWPRHPAYHAVMPSYAQLMCVSCKHFAAS